MVDVHYISAGKHYLMAEIVTGSDLRRPDNVPPPLTPGAISGRPQNGVIHRNNLSETTEAPEGHPAWVHITVIVVAVAVIFRLCMIVFTLDT